MNKRKQLVTIDEAVPAVGQHKKPCDDCPWARKALKGWLGGVSIDTWLAEAHGEAPIDCHTLAGAQCAGAAIYRANCLKNPRDKSILKLPPDKTLVFGNPNEFIEHHRRKERPCPDTSDCPPTSTPASPPSATSRPRPSATPTKSTRRSSRAKKKG